MQPGRCLCLGALSLALAAPACGGNVSVGTNGSGASAGANGGTGGDAGATSTHSSTSTGGVGAGGAGGTSGVGAGGTTTGGGTGGAEFCAGACAKIEDPGCFQPSACQSYCKSSAPAWPDDVRAAFAKCVAGTPLCFLTIEGCMLSLLYPKDTPKTIRLTGKGFDAQNGLVFRVWNDPGAGTPFGGEAPIAGGAFSFEWKEPVYISDTGGPLLLAYIDVDGDGACNAKADLTVAAATQWNGDFTAPVFETDLIPALPDPDFVCDFPP